MKRIVQSPKVFLLSFIPVLLCLLSATAQALPASRAFEGKLPAIADKSANRLVDLTFTLYNAETGGQPEWTEIHLGVLLKNNHFQVKLGKNNPLNKLDPKKNYYLATQIGLKMDAPEAGARKLLFKAIAPAVDQKPAQDVQPPAQAPAHRSLSPASPSLVSKPEIIAPAAQITLPGPSSTRAINSISQQLEKHIRDKSIHYRQGKGSHLDADLLDGKDSSYFAGKAMIEAHVQNKKNPHAVTAAQIDTYSRAEVAGMIQKMQQQISALQEKLKYVTVNGSDMRISAANLHVENGSGSTSGKVNGLGNIIIGYAEPRAGVNIRTGSHNLIIGDKHNYSSYAGLVAGYHNAISAPYANVCGGTNNTAEGQYTSVTGGRNNTAKGENSSVSGGIKNITSGEDDWAAGGLFQTQ